jgi:penicillin-insensitive murein endopeptidase
MRYRGIVDKPGYLALAALALALSLGSTEASAAREGKGKGATAHAVGSARRTAKTSAPPARRHAGSVKPDASAKGAPSGASAKGAVSGAKKATARKTPPAPPPPPPHSVGHPNEGRLEGGARLDGTLPYLRVMPTALADDARWGLPVFIRMIERAARGVSKRYPGSILDVGDISRKNGGEIDGHHSHESGRDVDIGFYAVDAKGKPVRASSFIKFDASLTSPSFPGARFDLARNWLLIQHLLTDPGARVSHIFIAEPLRQSLLAYARARGVSRALWIRAAVTMMQPTESLPHDDHIHVRISCPRSMRDSCIELSKNAPTGKTRLARRRRGGATTLKTPARAAAASRSAGTARGAPGSHAAHATRAAEPRGGLVRPARAEAAKSPAASPAEHAILQRAPSAPSASKNEAEAEADAIEVKDALDESGAAKITQ